MKFEISELDDGSFLLHAERRWGNDSDNETMDLSFPTFEKMLLKIKGMMRREYKMREKNGT